MCNKCPQGKYSLEAGADECLICPKNTQCEGGDVIRVNEGYWRSGILSDEIHECLDDAACLGDDGSTDDEEIPYQCAKGHSGNLCTKCIEEDGK